MLSKDEIRSAKYADLPSALKNLGFNLVVEGKSFYLHEHNSLKFFKKNDIWLYKWWSKDEVGDGIQYLMKYCEMKFGEAVKLLLGKQFQNVESKSTLSTCFNIKSRKLIKIAVSKLFEPNGEERYMYLCNERGFRNNTIKRYKLGWLPKWHQMPSKLVVPCYKSNGYLVSVKFRMDHPDMEGKRYRTMKGSDTSIPFTSGIRPQKPVVIVESELDAILIAQESGKEIGVLALGGVGYRLNNRIICYLNEKIPVNLISLDNDNPGRTRCESLKKVLKNAYAWPVPKEYGKDPGEAWKQMSIKKWIIEGLNFYKRSEKCQSK